MMPSVWVAYHIDIHRPSGTWVESRNVKAYTIPLRSLIVKDFEGLMVAGKCFSATHEALASTRVVPICMGMGEAAGTAAALACEFRGFRSGFGYLQPAKCSPVSRGGDWSDVGGTQFGTY